MYIIILLKTGIYFYINSFRYPYSILIQNPENSSHLFKKLTILRLRAFLFYVDL